jgi:uncharacterized Zn finger protein (UPF0148 family)
VTLEKDLDAISDQASTDCNHIPDAGKMVGHATDKRCPRCNCTLLRNANGDEWCSFVGGREEKACTYGLDSPPKAEELKEAAKEYARRYQDHSIDALIYLTRPATETLAESVFIAGAEWANTRPAPEVMKDMSQQYFDTLKVNAELGAKLTDALVEIAEHKASAPEVIAGAWVIIHENGLWFDDRTYYTQMSAEEFMRSCRADQAGCRVVPVVISRAR